MPFGGLLALAPAALSVGSSLFGLGSGSPAQNVKGYDYAYRPQADQAAYGGISQLSGLANQGATAAQNVQNNPYAGSYLSNIQSVGGQGLGSGQALAQAGLGTLPDVQALLSLGFDPQSALYAKLQNQNQQQNAAILGQSGVANTPYGAGVAADANSNFNINWQNQQLQRAIQGAQGASGLLGQAGSTVGTGLGLMQQGAALPYQSYTGMQTDTLGALGQASGLGQTATNDWLAYLSGGTNQQGANLSQANSAFNQSQQMGAGLGQGLAGLAKGWGNLGGGSWGQSNPGAFGSSFFGPVAP
jgi:hypothetical protein